MHWGVKGLGRDDQVSALGAGVVTKEPCRTVDMSRPRQQRW
jgi:hypothetical protein